MVNEACTHQLMVFTTIKPKKKNNKRRRRRRGDGIYKQVRRQLSTYTPIGSIGFTEIFLKKIICILKKKKKSSYLPQKNILIRPTKIYFFHFILQFHGNKNNQFC